MPKPTVKRNVLFVCSRNQWRSPKAKHTVNEGDIAWADVVMVMEPKHKSRLVADFPAPLRYKPLHVLDIPDEYQYMDPELVEMLEQAVPALLSLQA